MKPPKFEHIFIAVIIFPPLFCADTYGNSLLLVVCALKEGTIPETNEIVKNICSCHNFFPLSSVQIIIIPACCLLCVL